MRKAPEVPSVIFLIVALFLYPLSLLALDNPGISEYSALPEVSLVAITPDGNTIAYSKVKDDKKQVIVYSLKSRKSLATLDLDDSNLTGLFFLTNEELILRRSTIANLVNFRGDSEFSTAAAYNLKTKELRHLLIPGDVIYHGQSSTARIIGVSRDQKSVYMPAYVKDDRSELRYSLMAVDLDSPRRPKVHFRGTTSSIDFFLDDNGEVIVHELFDDRRNVHRILAKQAAGNWKEIYSEETELVSITAVGLTPSRDKLVIIDSNAQSGRDDYYLIDLRDGTRELAGYGREDADIESAYTDFARIVRGLRYSGFTPNYLFFDPGLQELITEIQTDFPQHSIWVQDWTANNEDVIVFIEGPHMSGDFLRISKGKKSIILASSRPSIEPEHIHPTALTAYKARDGLRIPTLLTIPKDKVDNLKQLPAIILPHGGPAAYDRVGFDWFAQALANEGYLVIQPQFRGSTGFGYDHFRAGAGEWGKKMQDDLSDGVASFEKSGLINPEQVCIVGMSYGGYAALAGGAFTPQLYQCVVSINGVSDLEQMLNEEVRDHGRDDWVVSYWQNQILSEGTSKDLLAEFSPAVHAKSFEAPVLLVHGERDLNVPIDQSEIMYKRLKAENKNATFLKLKGESHDLISSESRKATLDAVLAFVSKHIH